MFIRVNAAIKPCHSLVHDSELASTVILRKCKSVLLLCNCDVAASHACEVVWQTGNVLIWNALLGRETMWGWEGKKIIHAGLHAIVRGGLLLKLLIIVWRVGLVLVGESQISKTLVLFQTIVSCLPTVDKIYRHLHHALMQSLLQI